MLSGQRDTIARNRDAMSTAKFLVDPHKGVGPVRFGMTRAEAHQVLGSTTETVDRRRKGGELIDFFPAHDRLQVVYDAAERVAAVQFPVVDDVVYPPDVRLNRSYNKLLAWAQTQGSVIVEEPQSFRSDVLGIGARSRTRAGGKLEGIIVYRPRYYEDAGETKRAWVASKGGNT
jgi:hypothetical protein